MAEVINVQKFYEGLLDLSSSVSSGSGGEKQELELHDLLTNGLEDLSEIKDNQLDH